MQEYITLPDIYVTGGCSEEMQFNMLSGNNVPLELTDFEINFSVANYSDLGGTPVINLSSSDAQSQISIVEYEGIDAGIKVSISPSDTRYLSGKYIYQIAITDDSDNSVSFQGIMHIRRNINPAFIEE